MQVSPYLIFTGNCEEALNFYAKAMNGQIKNLMRFGGSPAEEMAADKNNVLHAEFTAGDVYLMASDGNKEQLTGGPVHLSLNFDSVEEEEKVFAAMSEGGKVTMALDDTFWGARFGMLTDKYGINWMFNCDKGNKND